MVAALPRERRSTSLAPSRPGRGEVHFPSEEISSCRGRQDDCRQLSETIVCLHRAWLRRDVRKYLSLSTADVTRLSQRSGVIQDGREQVRRGLPAEWRAFERSSGAIALRMNIRGAEISVDGDAATVVYRVDVSGGNRWDFDDQGVVFQAFVREGGVWKLAHQTDSWNLELGGVPGAPAGLMEFDYVYPVRDLARALSFYRPFLGSPEAVGGGRAVFNLGGARFVLDEGRLRGYARIEEGLPNGYPEFHVGDLRAEFQRLGKLGVSFLTGVETRGPDLWAAAEDRAGNVFVLVQRRVTSSGAEAPRAPAIRADETVPPEIVSAVERLMGAWLRMDKAGVAAAAGAGLRWFDDTRSRTRGIASSADALDWSGYDRTSAGLRAEMAVDSLKVRRLGAWTLVSYRMHLTGTGTHPFREDSLVTHAFKDGRPAQTFIVASYAPAAMVFSLDYTGHPVVDLRSAEDFYTKVMRFGDPYSDSQYRGYWSPNSVFGIYVADPKADRLPRAHRTNGYASFWIESATAVYSRLKKAGSTFPVVPAINSRPGPDREPGYIQIYATDSEGNGVLFSEYPAN